MNFKFDHSQEKIHDALGISEQELVEVEMKSRTVKEIYLKSVMENALQRTDEDKVSMSELVEIYSSQFTKEQLALITAVSVKTQVVNFFENNEEMLVSLIPIIGKSIINNSPKNDKDGK